MGEGQVQKRDQLQIGEGQVQKRDQLQRGEGQVQKLDQIQMEHWPPVWEQGLNVIQDGEQNELMG